jgi:hypothetical protein
MKNRQRLSLVLMVEGILSAVIGLILLGAAWARGGESAGRLVWLGVFFLFIGLVLAAVRFYQFVWPELRKEQESGFAARRREVQEQYEAARPAGALSWERLVDARWKSAAMALGVLSILFLFLLMIRRDESPVERVGGGAVAGEEAPGGELPVVAAAPVVPEVDLEEILWMEPFRFPGSARRIDRNRLTIAFPRPIVDATPELTPAGRSYLNQLVALVQESTYPILVDVLSYGSGAPDDPLRFQLGMNRASRVAQHLINEGIDPSRVTVRSSVESPDDLDYGQVIRVALRRMTDKDMVGGLVRPPVPEVVEKVVERVVERTVEVPVETVIEVERVVEVPVEVVREVERVVTAEVAAVSGPVAEPVAPVEIIVERVVEKPVEVIVERVVDRPVEVIVEKQVEVIREVERLVEVQVTVTNVVERLVEVPVAVTSVVERLVEVPVEVVREVERIVEVPVAAAATPVAAEVAVAAVAEVPAGLVIVRADLCREVFGFGSFDGFSENRFVRGRMPELLLYTELSGFASTLAADGAHEVRLTQTLSLYREGALEGEPVWAEQPVPVDDRSFSPRRDFFLAQLVRIPPRLAIGDYVLRVEVLDRGTGQVARSEVPVSIVAR